MPKTAPPKNALTVAPKLSKQPARIDRDLNRKADRVIARISTPTKPR